MSNGWIPQSSHLETPQEAIARRDRERLALAAQRREDYAETRKKRLSHGDGNRFMGGQAAPAGLEQLMSLAREQAPEVEMFVTKLERDDA